MPLFNTNFCGLNFSAFRQIVGCDVNEYPPKKENPQHHEYYKQHYATFYEILFLVSFESDYYHKSLVTICITI